MNFEEYAKHAYPQLQMVLSNSQQRPMLPVTVPDGYVLRCYQPGDEPQLYKLMDTGDAWPVWNDEQLKPYLYQMVPDGWYVAVHKASDEIVSSAMGLHDASWRTPFCSELGWVVTHPQHQGKGLARAVVSSVVNRLLEIRYPNIHLRTEHHRLAAIHIYLSLGFEPLIDDEEDREVWQAVHEQLVFCHR